MTTDERIRFEKADRIRELIPEIGELMRKEHALVKPSEWRDRAAYAGKRRAAEDERRALRNELADEFGARYGWKQKQSVASDCFYKLMANPWRCGKGNWHLPWDHPDFYRRGRWLKAVAVHVYENVDPAGLEATAVALGLAARIIPPDEFPSWWYPGRTTLVLYTSAGEIVTGGMQ